MHIRPIQLGDRGEWLRLLGDLYPHHSESRHAPALDAFFMGLTHHELLPVEVFVCERGDGMLGGFLELTVRPYAEGCAGPTPYVESWYVDPDLRGRGVGRLLLGAAEQWARERNYRELASDAELKNVASQRAHEALGFHEVERAIHFRKGL